MVNLKKGVTPMPNTTGKDFMRLTRYAHLEPSGEKQGTPQPLLELPYAPDAPRVKLPAPGELRVPALDLRDAIAMRRTLRSYSEQPLSLDELTYLLWASQGVQKVSRRPATLRTVPSAGARHAFETFVLANRVAGMAPGLYRYAAIEHALLEVDLSEDVAERCAHACLDQGQVARAAVTFVWVAVVERMVWRYGERGYRYLHLDAGHVCQNLYLAAEGIGAGACAIAAFDDDLLNQAVGADGENLFAIYAAAVGKRPAA
jgi:SagB-type dehydrogenase family enzyme